MNLGHHRRKEAKREAKSYAEGAEVRKGRREEGFIARKPRNAKTVPRSADSVRNDGFSFWTIHKGDHGRHRRERLCHWCGAQDAGIEEGSLLRSG